MTAISYFAAAQQAFQQRMDAAITAISEDIAALNEQIAVLQNSGTISDADQLLLNELHTRTEDIATKLERVDAMKGEAPTPPAG